MSRFLWLKLRCVGLAGGSNERRDNLLWAHRTTVQRIAEMIEQSERILPRGTG
ncbi:MAG: hypothetical protein RX316_05375 [bacterium]|nr:hypothetical protein [bacterium]